MFKPHKLHFLYDYTIYNSYIHALLPLWRCVQVWGFEPVHGVWGSFPIAGAAMRLVGPPFSHCTGCSGDREDAPSRIGATVLTSSV